MRRITVCLCLAVLAVGFFVSHAHAVTLHFSVTFDENSFKDCDEPFCQLLAKIYEFHSRDIENVAAAYSTDDAHTLNINVNVSHSSSWWKKILGWFKTAPVKADTPTFEPPVPEPVPVSKPKPEPELSELVELVNRRDYSWLKEFYDAGALARVDYVSNIPKENYFTEGGRTFCEVFPGGSRPEYGFVDRDALRKSLKSLYGDEFSVSGSSSFSCRLSSDKEINLKAEDFLLSTKSLSPVKTKLGEPGPEKFGSKRFFFKTNLEDVELVVVPKDSRQKPRFFLAADKSIINVKKLNDALLVSKPNDALLRNIESDGQKVTFRFVTPVDLIERRDFENCIDIFVRQIVETSQVIETVR